MWKLRSQIESKNSTDASKDIDTSVNDTQNDKKLFELEDGWENEVFDPRYEKWRLAMFEVLLADNPEYPYYDEEYPLIIPPDLAILLSDMEL
ncbi:hypothetical protein HK100_010154 [Physocladia obscura]|uniref:Uncharacterized protein n=1 Tax=Physocladia obscura TaxID=109957 RepID=A0AAD5T4E8_9FUNG|nr:hypothetical protein HK100_010154 [Physocladia obscura]